MWFWTWADSPWRRPEAPNGCIETHNHTYSTQGTVAINNRRWAHLKPVAVD